jgi:tetratricopeptide (TPR) repeat protein
MVSPQVIESAKDFRSCPFSLAVNNLRCNVLVGLRQYDRATEQYRILLEIAPEEIGRYQHLARILWLQGRVAEAVAEERRIASVEHLEPWERGLAEVEAAYETGGFRSACLKLAQLKEWLYQHSLYDGFSTGMLATIGKCSSGWTDCFASQAITVR